MIRVTYIKLEQPIGDMYMVKLPAEKVAEISASKTRKSYNDHVGIQRKLDKNRIRSIADFCQKKDAMFPTPIILSASSEFFVLDEKANFIIIPEIKDGEDKLCSIVDGQHRLEGLKESGRISEFDLLVSFVFDTDPSKDAYLFSIINGNQKPVSKSLIYDLYGLSKYRTVEKLCNKVMQNLNAWGSSLEGKIKMLGYKDEYSQDGLVSQATMIKNLMKLITDNSERDNKDIEFGNPLKSLPLEKYIFRKYFVQSDDKLIIDESIIFFNSWIKSLEKVKNEDSTDTFKIFTKTIGFSVSYRILNLLYLAYNFQSNIGNDNVRKEQFYISSLESMFKNFLCIFSNKIYSSSESGITELFIDLSAILWNCESVSEKIIRKVATKEQMKKIILRKNELKIM